MTDTSPNLVDSINKRKLMTDVEAIPSNTGTLLKQATFSNSEKAAELREHSMDMLRQAKKKTQDLQDVIVRKSKAATRATNDYIHDRPRQVVGMATGVDLLIDLLLNRK